MQLDFCSRRDLTARLEAGWRLVPGHVYRPDDWAILLLLPEAPEVLTADQVLDMARPFLPSFREKQDNRTAGALSAATRRPVTDSVTLAERRRRHAETKRENRKAEREAQEREFIRRKMELA